MGNGKMHPLIASALAAPATHVVVTRYACGKERRHDVRSRAAGDNYATGERRKIGRDLIERATGETVRVVSVSIEML